MNDIDPKDALYQAKIIILRLNNQEISYDEAKALCEPYFNVINESGKKIAKECGMKYRPVSFASFRR